MGLSPRRSAVDVVEDLRSMIVSGDLLPGQQIRQDAMAQRLGVSRLPIREALRSLTAEGLVKHTPNVGYTVTRLSQDEFDEIYLMRKVLETELIKAIPAPSTEQVDSIERCNDLMVEASRHGDFTAVQRHNRDFHFAIFDLSPLKLVIGEVGRLWTWASPYQSVSLHSPGNQQKILDEHLIIIAALRRGDPSALIAALDDHRHGSELQMSGVPWLIRSS
jgi:DNA-binding GntR family transcriptional regulator